MKISIDLPQLIEHQLGRSLFEIPVSIDVDTFLEATGLEDSELDLRELLARERAIGLIYTTDDVHVVRPHLSDEQAWAVLQGIDQSVDQVPEFGMSFDTIRHFADEMFPEGLDDTLNDGGRS